jgi:hypothetical protein
MPVMLNMVVGDTHTIQALSSTDQSVTGLTWASSDPTVVSLSADDPPIVTALAAGRVTITAGSASADVTVFAVALPMGTVIWSNPGDGSGVTSIVPAVPSPTGVADVFALQNDSTIQAITSDGTTAWTLCRTSGRRRHAPWTYQQVVPDFQGGLVFADSWSNSITKVDLAIRLTSERENRPKTNDFSERRGCSHVVAPSCMASITALRNQSARAGHTKGKQRETRAHTGLLILFPLRKRPRSCWRGPPMGAWNGK